MNSPHNFNSSYQGAELDHLGFPVGGLGAGMFCIEGNGALARFSLRHRPDLFHEPQVFAALSTKIGSGVRSAKILEGPLPSWKPMFAWDRFHASSGMGGSDHTFGLPRFDSARFDARFPFGTVSLEDETVPLDTKITAWSPFTPGDADSSSLPVGAVEYRFRNNGIEPVDTVFSFHARNFMATGKEGASVSGTAGGYILRQDAQADRPESQGAFAAWIAKDTAATTDACWYRGEWFDSLTMLWKAIEEGRGISNEPVSQGLPSPGGSLYLPFTLAPGAEKTITLLVAWHVPYSTVRAGYPTESLDPRTNCYRPWYAEVFPTIEDVIAHWEENAAALRLKSRSFSDCFYDSTLPPEVMEAVGANLSILKSPTILREHSGKLWAWEGCQDEWGSCPGSCTHVWNYAQAIPHLFPSLERSLRDTEFRISQDERGHQNFRSRLPLAVADHEFLAAADGQLGGIVKVYRDWRISGDTEWLRSLWPQVRQSLEYCIKTWDPDRTGMLLEPHHNTYDIEFWGADGMCGSVYLAALQAAIAIGSALGEDVESYRAILNSGKERVEVDLFNGEYFEQKVQCERLQFDDTLRRQCDKYFEQKIQCEGLNSDGPLENVTVGSRGKFSEEARTLLLKEGPNYQYGRGCLADGIIGEWMAWAAGLGPVLDTEKTKSHLLSVHRYNLRKDFASFANPQRPSYAFGHEAGLVLCTWPRGGEVTLPFPYSNEVWTGIEYQVAAHLISSGAVTEGLEIVQACRQRYSGTVRNPFDEIECGHWYARALSSYSLLQALGGARYDAVEKVLYLTPRIEGDYRCFLAAETGYGTVGVRNGTPFLDVCSGRIDVTRIEYCR